MFWGEKPYHSLDYEMKQRFGEKVYRLSLNGGMTCPNRDGTVGTGGCIFCSAGGSGDFAAPAVLPISEQLRMQKELIAKKRPVHKYIAYFQAYTNTYAPVEYLERIFSGSHIRSGGRRAFHCHAPGLPWRRGTRTASPSEPDQAGLGRARTADDPRRYRPFYPARLSALLLCCCRHTAAGHRH